MAVLKKSTGADCTMHMYYLCYRASARVTLLKQHCSTCESCVQSTVHSYVLRGICMCYPDSVDSVVLHPDSVVHSYVLRCMQRAPVGAVFKALCTLHSYMLRGICTACVTLTVLRVTLYAESTCGGSWHGARGRKAVSDGEGAQAQVLNSRHSFQNRIQCQVMSHKC